MDLVKFNQRATLPAFGFNNLGFTCYFNALLQGMLSCTAFTEELIQRKDDEKYDSNPVTQHIIQLIELAMHYKTLLDRNKSGEDKTAAIKSAELRLNNLSPTIWRNMIMFLHVQKKKQIQTFSTGQQCAREGYHFLMESLEDFDGIQNLFLHRYRSLIYCFDCEKWVSKKEDNYSLFEVQANLKTEQLERFKQLDDSTVDMNQFLTRQDGYIDKDYRCPECEATKKPDENAVNPKPRTEKYSRTVLVMAPEILVVMSKKYTMEQKLDVYTEFPKTLTFKGHDKKKDKSFPMHYEAVAQIEHTGGLNGGHYWAVCRRNDGWYNLNDNRVTKSEFGPTKNTYIVIYHIMNSD
jgi:ubiquitin C-terminal hydrolase